MGVSVETAVIDTSYINKLRLEGQDIPRATFEASMVRLRPIMMTALVACLGLLPAAFSHGIGSDSSGPLPSSLWRPGLKIVSRPHRESRPVPNGGPQRRRAPGLTQALDTASMNEQMAVVIRRSPVDPYNRRGRSLPCARLLQRAIYIRDRDSQKRA